MTKILAIDPGTNQLGLYDGENCGTLEATKKWHRPQRLSFMMSELTDFLDIHGPYDFIVYEGQFVRGGAATKALFGVVGVVEAVAHFNGAGVMDVPQATVTKWCKEKAGIEKGAKVDRKALMEQVVNGMNPAVVPESEHEYDAACLWYYIKEKGLING